MPGEIHPKNRYALGADISRMGEDKTVLIVIEIQWNKSTKYVVYIEELYHKKTTEVVGRIMQLNEHFKFEKCYVDTTGLGAGVGDMLAEHLGNYIVECKVFSNIMKVDMYSNLKKVMEQGVLKFPYHKKLVNELRTLKYELTNNGSLKITHPEGNKYHDDYPDALALAALWLKEEETSEYEAFIM